MKSFDLINQGKVVQRSRDIIGCGCAQERVTSAFLGGSVVPMLL